MTMTAQFNFLRVRNGICYFARVAVSADVGSTGVRISDAVDEGEWTNEPWRAAALVGAGNALARHLDAGGEQSALLVTAILGTDVDTTPNSVEVAAFGAAWIALGHPESQLDISFGDKWTVSSKPDVSPSVTKNGDT